MSENLNEKRNEKRSEGQGLPRSINLGGKVLELPILQGGMGIGVSLGSLAGAVAACGGMGTISTAMPGFNEPDYAEDPEGANLRALAREIRRAKEIAGGRGLVAINAMVATTKYADSVRTAIEAGADAVVSGAGLPLDLPAIAAGIGADTLLAPIVSSGRAAATICRLWEKRYRVLPGFVVVEGSEAGGHLGFAKEDLLSGSIAPLETLVAEVAAALVPFEERAGRRIPVFAAGGVWDGADAARLAACGAAGIQIATRLIATYECDASQGLKDILIAAKKEDIQLVQSPVGMPGRALRTPLIRRLEAGESAPSSGCTGCLVPCPRGKAPYCISEALVAAVRGDVENGLFFCGSNAWRLEGMHHAADVLESIMAEWNDAAC